MRSTSFLCGQIPKQATHPDRAGFVTASNHNICKWHSRVQSRCQDRLVRVA